MSTDTRSVIAVDRKRASAPAARAPKSTTGDKVVVERVDGLKLLVRKIPENG